ncbi:putative NBD/HSP70 family sugar kinase [Curtobacterium sp. PhB130]|uniref:ROK family transcriptional regulator n=1 Tax=unclassified Curtobacterium TaxID=257496 RepID=UPI000F4CBC11|nr:MULTISPECIES: ROK family transcriptional regulator [unclassified Curtobacterium]ROP64575.1 putative NBD/HSP70 family sugar kinase [Curtobacterium sp. ZW137]ROS74875.1 putative NBD/HSP70 family sugar kinase [Curtobacterium sp. PhB130]TCK63489.1 putative NBD/HSP70 family sugar kinase [Curtobacterium sp. PhB136]
MTTRGRTPGQPALLRVLNDRAALGMLLDDGPMTRNEIAQRTGLSKPTAAEIIRRLEAAGLIHEAGTETQTGRRGPSAVVYGATTDRDLAVAVDVQLVDVRSTVVDATGRTYPVAEHRMSDAEVRAPGEDIVAAAVGRAAAAAGVDPDLVTAVAVGVQASVDHATDTLIFTDGLPGWPREQVSATLSRALGVQVVVENDANLAAIAERNMGAGRALGSFALLWMAEGLGMALDLGGRLHAGASGAAGEIGYLSVPADALPLDPTATIVADLISETAITALAAEHGITAPDGTAADWRQVLPQLPGLPEQHPFTTALGERVGHNVLPALAVADPETVVLHGPTGIAGGPALAAAVTAWLRTRSRWSTAVVAPGVPDTPVLHGARHVLIDVVRTALADRLDRISDDATEPDPVQRA